MTVTVDEKGIKQNKLTEVWSVQDFARRYRLDAKEELRLVALFGRFATASELLMNCRRPAIFR